MLTLSPMGRYSTNEALSHPWLDDVQGGEERGWGSRSDSLHTVHEMMRRFYAEQKCA